MDSILLDEFLELFRELPSEIREQTRQSYRLWKANPQHPGLQFKRLRTNSPVYSVRVGKNWRAVGTLQDDTMIWWWIGSHAEYDKLLSRLK